MDNYRLNRYLNSVGKECFVTYFHLFIDSNIPNYEIVETILKEKGYTEKACNSRTGHARMILREGGAKEALRIVTESTRLNEKIVELARQHLKSIT